MKTRIQPNYYDDIFVGFRVEVWNEHSKAFEAVGVNHPRYVGALLALRAIDTGKPPVRGVVSDERVNPSEYRSVQRSRFIYRCRERLARALQVAGITAALFGMFGCASFGDKWSEDNTAAEIAYQAINMVDALQTDRIRYRDDIYENGPLASRVIGREPSRSDVVGYFATLAISHALISAALPDSWRPWWQGATAISQGYTVMRNCTKHELLCK